MRTLGCFFVCFIAGCSGEIAWAPPSAHIPGPDGSEIPDPTDDRGVGDGTLLDQAAILGVTDVQEGQSHRLVDIPVLVAGAAGGGLRSPSVHLRPRGENVTRVHLTLLQALGLPFDRFGTAICQTDRPLTELL